MKTEEDEAFDELAAKQGHWNGGFMAKRAMAANKLQEPPSEWAGIKAILDEYGLQAIDFVADFKAALAQPAQEPVGFMNAGHVYELQQKRITYGYVYPEKETGASVAVYTTAPPQRTWVGLTDEEIAQGNKESWVDRQAFESAVWWAEAKLKEKNT